MHSLLGDGAVAMVADGLALRGPSTCCVPLSQIGTPWHLSIFGTRAATVLCLSPGSQVFALNPHCQGHTAIAMNPTPFLDVNSDPLWPESAATVLSPVLL